MKPSIAQLRMRADLEDGTIKLEQLNPEPQPFIPKAPANEPFTATPRKD